MRSSRHDGDSKAGAGGDGPVSGALTLAGVLIANGLLIALTYVALSGPLASGTWGKVPPRLTAGPGQLLAAPVRPVARVDGATPGQAPAADSKCPAKAERPSGKLPSRRS